MKKSACNLLLYRTYSEIWRRGEEYADSQRIKIVNADDKTIEAEVRGTRTYFTALVFYGNGIRKGCSCPYIKSYSEKAICKHMAAVAIVWDELRGIERPDKTAIESQAIPPPLITPKDVEAVYKEPLRGDLDILRIAADELGWGGAHVRLPNMPKFETDSERPLNLAEVQQAFREIARWTGRQSFHDYLCAGEMAAAFCEVLRLIKKRLPVSSPPVSALVLREAQKFHYELVMELIDDSDGHWQINEAHLEDIYQTLKESRVDRKEEKQFQELLEEFSSHRGEY